MGPFSLAKVGQLFIASRQEAIDGLWISEQVGMMRDDFEKLVEPRVRSDYIMWNDKDQLVALDLPGLLKSLA